MHTYDKTFFKYLNTGATRSANIVIPLLTKHLKIDSVVDFGCGQGAWLAAWKSHGASRIAGIDGEYVDQESLLVEPSEFLSHDLSQPIDLDEKFDLVQSLEVAEHLPKQAAHTFIASLVTHGDIVLFSAAVPGQGGENHINEQPYQYWRRLFAELGYIPIDAIRPHIHRNGSVERWYRYNSILYVKKTILSQLPDEFKRQVITEDCPVPDISPPLYKTRKLILMIFPPIVYTWIATLKKHFYVFAKRFFN